MIRNGESRQGGKIDEKGVDQSGGKLYLIYYLTPQDVIIFLLYKNIWLE
jgi:hypothetical protein